MSIVKVSKKPTQLLTVTDSNNYSNLTQSELLTKVKMLHNQLLKTNEYLMMVHRLSVYNWSEEDDGNIIVELHDNKQGFLLDSVLRLRGSWDPLTNTPELKEEDETRKGWLYKVKTAEASVLFGVGWKDGDYALYDENGKLYNVSADILASLFTPIIPQESTSILINTINDPSGIQIQAHLKVDPREDNDIKVSDTGVYSDAYKRAQDLIQLRVTAPTEDNTSDAFIIVYLLEEPEIMYRGYLYLIPEPTN